MLSNNLTLDDEDAVQEELRQLQAEIVRTNIGVASIDVSNYLIQKGTKDVELPSVPEGSPKSRVQVEAEPEGKVPFAIVRSLLIVRRANGRKGQGKDRGTGMTIIHPLPTSLTTNPRSLQSQFCASLVSFRLQELATLPQVA